jgi:hypothetical protein
MHFVPNISPGVNVMDNNNDGVLKNSPPKLNFYKTDFCAPNKWFSTEEKLCFGTVPRTKCIFSYIHEKVAVNTPTNNYIHKEHIFLILFAPKLRPPKVRL